MLIRRLFCLPAALLLLAFSCRNEPVSPPSAPRYVEAAKALPEGVLTLIDTVRLDLTHDQRAEWIGLSADVRRARNGALLWEDGHRWRLLVRDDTGRAYALLDEFVPMGQVRYWVVAAEQRTSVMVRTESSTSGIVVRRFTFEPDRGRFRIDELESGGAIRHASPAIF